MGSAGDRVREAARQAARVAYNNFLSLSEGGAEGNWFVGEISQDQKYITHPNGKKYKLLFTGQLRKHMPACIVTKDTAYVVGSKLTQSSIIEPVGGTPWFIIGAYDNSNQGWPSPVSVLPEFNLVNGSTLDQYRIPKEAFSDLYGTPPLSYGDDSGFLEPISGAWKVSVSSNLKYIVLVRVVYHAFTDVVIVTTDARNTVECSFPHVYWAIIKDFKLGTNVLDLSDATITEGNTVYEFAGSQVARYTPSSRNSITTSEDQSAQPVISFTGTSGAPVIDVVLSCTSEASQVSGADKEFVASTGAALDISGSNTLTSFVEDYETYAVNPAIANLGELYHISGSTNVNFSAVHTVTSTAAQASKEPHVFNSSPTVSGRSYLNPYNVASADDNNIFIMDGLRYYPSHNTETGWTGGSAIKCVTDEKFNELVKVSLGGGAFRYSIKSWRYNSDNDTFSSSKTFKINDLSSGFSTLTESGSYPHYYIMDWIVK